MLKFVAGGAAVAGGPVGIALAAGAAALQAYRIYQARKIEEEPQAEPPPVVILTDDRAEQAAAVAKSLDERAAWLDNRYARLRADQQAFKKVEAHTKSTMDAMPAALASLEELKAGQTEMQVKFDELERLRRASDEARAKSEALVRRLKIGGFVIAVPGYLFSAYSAGKSLGWL